MTTPSTTADDRCNAYRVSGANPEDGCALVFHVTGRKARNLAWSEISWIPDLVDWIGQLAVRKLTGDHLWRDRTTTEPETVESPIGCPACELWGGEPVTLEREKDIWIWKRGEKVMLPRNRPDFEKGEEFEACAFCEGDDDRHNWR